MGAFQTTPPNERLLNAVANARKSLQAGVTTVRDVGSSIGFAERPRRDRSGQIPGPRMRCAGAVLCMTGGHGWPIGRAVDSPWDARKAVREQLWAGADCIKLIATGGVLTKGAVPGNAQLHARRARRRRRGSAPPRFARRRARDRNGRHQERAARRHRFDRARAPCSTTKRSSSSKQRGTYLVPTLSAPTCILAHLEDGHQPQYVVDKARGLERRDAEESAACVRQRRPLRRRLRRGNAVQLPRELRARSRTDVVAARHDAAAGAARGHRRRRRTDRFAPRHRSPSGNPPTCCCSTGDAGEDVARAAAARNA